jgi:hypothetical protein
MQPAVSHDRGEESMEAKARWFQTLTMEERMAAFCAFTDLMLSLNPRLPDLKDAQLPQRRIRILSNA